MNKEKLCKFLKCRRKLLGKTQLEMGELIGVSDKVYSNWETGKTIISVEDLPKLCNALEISVSEYYACEVIADHEKKNEIESICENIIDMKEEEKKYAIKNETNKLKKKVLIILSFIVLIFTGIFIYFFMSNNFDNCYVYTMLSVENMKVKGEIIQTQEKEIISINEIVMDDFNDEQVYYIDYSLWINDQMIVQEGNVNQYVVFDNDPLKNLNDMIQDEVRVYINEEKEYNEYLDYSSKEANVKIIVNYIKEDKTIEHIEIPLIMKKEYSNNKIFYDGGNHI